MDKVPKIILIAMPFFDYRLPSAQIAVLKSYLEEKGVIVFSIYAYLDFYKIVGEKYCDILNKSQISEWMYISSVYPDRYKENKKEIESQLRCELGFSQEELYDCYNRIQEFNRNLLLKIESYKCDLIGFSITYNQLLPTLFIAKELKERDDRKKIILGGSRVKGELGLSLINKKNYFDHIISGEGEVTLLRYVQDYYFNRFSGKYINSKFIETKENVCLDELPVPDYSDYFKDIRQYNIEETEMILFYEVARGCWWNRCTFCSSSRLYSEYREKTPRKVAQDLQLLASKYNDIKIWLLGDCYTFKSYIELSKLIRKQKIKYNFIVYSRCSTDYNYYKALKEMGAKSIIVGIEALSDNLLKKMDKGCNVIRNMQCLKYCVELKLGCTYNLFYSYPNFTKEDFKEMMNSIDYVSGYQPPESLCDMELQYGSRVYKNPRDFCIEQVVPSKKEQMILPVNAKTFLYDYIKKNKMVYYSKRIIKKVKKWNSIYEKRGMSNILTFEIKENQIWINDNRKTFWHINSKYILKGKEIEIFLFCRRIRSLKEVRDKFSGKDTSSIIKKLKKKKLMYVSKTECLTLPVERREDYW